MSEPRSNAEPEAPDGESGAPEDQHGGPEAETAAAARIAGLEAAVADEAVYQVTDAAHPAGTVAEVLQEGYLHHDRLLRPATVGVAKNHDRP